MLPVRPHAPPIQNAIAVRTDRNPRGSGLLCDVSTHSISSGALMVKFRMRTCLIRGTQAGFTQINKGVGGTFYAVSSPTPTPTLADQGDSDSDSDSGAVYVYEEPDTLALVPVAIHCVSDREREQSLYGGCSIIDSLRKFIQKQLSTPEPPSAQDVLEWFTIAPSGEENP